MIKPHTAAELAAFLKRLPEWAVPRWTEDYGVHRVHRLGISQFSDDTHLRFSGYCGDGATYSLCADMAALLIAGHLVNVLAERGYFIGPSHSDILADGFSITHRGCYPEWGVNVCSTPLAALVAAAEKMGQEK